MTFFRNQLTSQATRGSTAFSLSKNIAIKTICHFLTQAIKLLAYERGKRQATAISCPSQILLIFLSKSPWNPKPSFKNRATLGLKWNIELLYIEKIVSIDLKFSSLMSLKPFLRAFSDIPGVECRKYSEFIELQSFLLIIVKTIEFFRVVPWGNWQAWYAKYFAIYFLSPLQRQKRFKFFSNIVLSLRIGNFKTHNNQRMCIPAFQVARTRTWGECGFDKILLWLAFLPSLFDYFEILTS